MKRCYAIGDKIVIVGSKADLDKLLPSGKKLRDAIGDDEDAIEVPVEILNDIEEIHPPVDNSKE